MSDTKELNNRLDNVERKKFELEEKVKELEGKLTAARREATYFRGECRALADRGNASRAIEETLARRLASHEHNAMPGDRIAAAAVIECGAVLEIVRSIIGGQQ